MLALRGAANTVHQQGARGRGSRAGRHLSPTTGRGLEFAGLRPYQSGDDPRSLDWRHTARRGRPFTKLFHEERERPVLILTDLGPTMHFGTRTVFKCVQAARVAALLAWAAIAAGDRVGGLVRRRDALQSLPPTGREAGALALLRALAANTADTDPDTPPLNQAIDRLRRLLRPGCELFVISDFAALDAATEHALLGLRGAQRLSLLRIADPLELAAPPPALYRIADGAGTAVLDLRRADDRAAYTAACEARAAQFAQLARRLDAAHLTLATDTPPHNVLALWHART